MKKILGFPKGKFMNWFTYWAVVGLATLILFFLITSSWIGYDVREKCEIAKARYLEECVESLIKVFEDETNSFRDRNGAVWALGQIGDKKALEVIKKYYTGEIPDREPYNEVLSQHEMKKAIKLLEGGFNATAFVWRRGDL